MTLYLCGCQDDREPGGWKFCKDHCPDCGDGPETRADAITDARWSQVESLIRQRKEIETELKRLGAM